MSDTLDLDQLLPDPKTVKVNGKVYELKPLKLTDFIVIQKLLASTQGKTDIEMIEVMGDMFTSLRPIVPDIDEMDLTIEQTLALMEFIYKQEQKNQPQATEKKTEVSPS
jgi:hypothetical protein